MKERGEPPPSPMPTFRELAREQLPPLASEEPTPLAARLHPHRPSSVGWPSRPVLGLPLARMIPQDVHSIMDYADGLVAASTAFATDDARARIASIVLASSAIGISAVTDYRLSAAKLVSIEAHEVTDHVWGLAAIAAPFVLGYWKTAPKVAIAHVVAGIGTIIASLVTDYRAYSTRSQTAAR